MSILPINSNLTITANDDNINEYNAYSVTKLKEYAWDFETDNFILENGKFVIVEDLEALKIRNYKKLKTQKNRFLLIYDRNYGSSLEDVIIGNGLSEIIKGKIKTIINDCLIDNNYVTNIIYNSFSLDEDKLNVEITLSTKYGSLDMEVIV